MVAVNAYDSIFRSNAWLKARRDTVRSSVTTCTLVCPQCERPVPPTGSILSLLYCRLARERFAREILIAVAVVFVKIILVAPKNIRQLRASVGGTVTVGVKLVLVRVVKIFSSHHALDSHQWNEITTLARLTAKEPLDNSEDPYHDSQCGVRNAYPQPACVKYTRM